MPTYYKGKYKLKNPAKYKGNPDDVVYRSAWERFAFRWCEDNPSVKKWNSEETIIPYRSEIDNRMHRYFVDLTIWFNDGTVFLVEIKPAVQTAPPKKPARKTKRYITESLEYVKNECKWKAARRVAKDNGWHFVIWTEEELTKMGMPSMNGKKKPKPFKPLKPMKKRTSTKAKKK